MATQTYLIIERFKNGAARPVYERFRDRGRLAPDGLTYVTSWVEESLGVCYQVMQAPDPALIDEWIRQWADLVDFEVRPVLSSAEAAARVLGVQSSR